MVETRTDRFELVQWSSGGDSPSRLDFNEAFWNLNTRAAIDPGITYSTLPATFPVGGRYALVVPPGDESAYRTIYRRNDAGGWDFAGGNAARAPFHFRANGQARTDAAVTLSHPDFAAAGGTLGYDGSAVLTGTVRVHDADDAGRGAVLVGTDAAPNLTTLGRLHVRTRATAERGIVVQPYTPGEGDTGSGNLFTARTAGGSDVLFVDALGRFRTVVGAAFGGGALAAAHSVVLAPTSNPADGVTNGLLLHGQAGAGATTKSILTVQRDTADTTPIAQFLRDGIGLGRLPWNTPGASDSSSITLSTNTLHFRTSGNPANTSYWVWRRSDPTSPATEANPALDTTLLSCGVAGIASGLPMFISQRHRQAVSTMALYRVGDFTNPFLDLARLVPNGSGGEDAQLMSTWGPDGRLRTGLPWRATGTCREVRQSITHLCNKRFTAQGSAALSGQLVNANSSFEYTWPLMTLRSADTADLDIITTIELMLGQNGNDGVDDAQAVLVDTFVSINGGAYNQVGFSENAPVSTSLIHRPGGDLMYCNHRLAGVPAGATFRVRTRFSAGDALPKIYLRMFDLKIQEAVFETYTAA